MKPSRRNLAAQTSRIEREAKGKPPLSKYEAKRRVTLTGGSSFHFSPEYIAQQGGAITGKT